MTNDNRPHTLETHESEMPNCSDPDCEFHHPLDGTPTRDNPHGFEQHVLDTIAKTSSDMYGHYYDLLATYQFDFSLEEKMWMLDQIVADIKKANREAEMELAHDDMTDQEVLDILGD